MVVRLVGSLAGTILTMVASLLVVWAARGVMVGGSDVLSVFGSGKPRSVSGGSDVVLHCPGGLMVAR